MEEGKRREKEVKLRWEPSETGGKVSDRKLWHGLGRSELCFMMRREAPETRRARTRSVSVARQTT